MLYSSSNLTWVGLKEVKHFSSSLTASNGRSWGPHIQSDDKACSSFNLGYLKWFRMKEADGIVNSRDRYLLKAFNSAQDIVKGEEYNGINISESPGTKTPSEFWKSGGRTVTRNFLVSWCEHSFAICGDPGGF